MTRCWASIGLLLAAGAFAQPVMPPKDHPPVHSPDRRKEASRLTHAVAGSSREQAAPVPHKNFIDEFIFGKMERDGIPHAPLATDTEFFRRVHLDLTGRIPDPEQLEAFLASHDPNKRDKLVDSLIGSPAFVAKWTYWFGDLSEAAHNRVGRDGVNLYYKYIYDNIHLNRPYNELVRELLTTSAISNWYVGPATYLVRWVVIGDTCADTVHEDTSDEIAVNAAKHFLGLNLQCISCHDGAGHLDKINLWLTQKKRRDLWRQAAFFGKTRVLRRVEIATTRDEYAIDEKGEGYDAGGRSVVRMPRRGKGMVEPAFILDGEKPQPGKPLREEFARMFTSTPQFARAAVNLFWSQLIGVGIVDPPGEFDLARLDPKNPPPKPWTIQPAHPELLEALAADFREHNYDLRRLMRLIAQSSVYQLSSQFPGEWTDSYARYYARKFVRRLTAEEIYDSINKATGLFTPIPVPGTDLKVKFATETRTPEDFKQRFPGFKDINFFLESFGQTNREYSERKNDGSVTQAVLLMNSPFVKEKVKAAPGSYLASLLEAKPPLADDQLFEKLYSRFLIRSPQPEELARARELVAQEGRSQGLEDLQWILVNKVEFLFNY